MATNRKSRSSGAGLPLEVEEAMLGAIRRAGYDPSDEFERLMGLNALTAALMVYDAAKGRGVRSQRVGRNDPCPCGSGRKHKKCCYGTAAAGLPEPPVSLPFPLDDPGLVPQVHRQDVFSEDMDALTRLFQEDPALCRIRFTGHVAAAFLAEEMADGVLGEDDDSPATRFEELLSSYLAEVEGPEVLGDLEAALLGAAPRWAADVADLRALSQGVALACLPGASDEEAEEQAVNPLYLLIFRETVREAVEAARGGAG